MKRASLIILIATSLLIVEPRTYSSVNAVTWGTITPLPGPDPNVNVFPKTLQLSNGSVWLIWEKAVTGLLGEIYLMTYNIYGWSGETRLVSSVYDDIAPSAIQLANGTIMVVWSRGTGMTGTYDIWGMGYNGARWTSPTPLVVAPGDDLDPDLAITGNGNIWMVWSRATSTNGQGDLYYKIYNGSTWGPEQPIATDALHEEKLPSVTVTADGRVWVVYEANYLTTPQIWYKTWNGMVWTNPAPLTNTVNIDKWPSVAQDRNGSIWVFWSRELPNGTSAGQTLYQWDLFYKNSTNNGASWSPDTTIVPNINGDEQHPAIMQGADKTLWVVFDSTQSLANPYGTPNLYMVKSGIIKAHDVAVGSTAQSPASPRTGEMVTFYASVSDPGDYAETSQVKFYVNTTFIGTSTVSISPGSTVTVAFTWDSTGYKPSRYPTRATIDQVPYEIFIQNNSANSTLLLVPRGDVNRDGTVNIVDLSIIASHFGATQATPGYVPDADLNHDGVINIVDLTICAADFGKTVS